MSEQGVIAFLILLSQDEKLQRRVKNFSKEQILNMAKELGYEFTEEELEFVQSEIIEGEPLPIEVLDKVVGGANLDYLIDWVKKKYFDF